MSEQTEQETEQQQPGELHQSLWAVITDTDCLASCLTYDQAIEYRRQYFKATSKGGAFIVTNGAAMRQTKGTTT